MGPRARTSPARLSLAPIAQVAVIALLCAGLTARPDPVSPRLNASGTTSVPAWLARINQVRAGAGLAPVTENTNWTQGLRNHVVYLARTPDRYRQGEYASSHTENPASPYYTASGAREAGRSDIGLGPSDVEAVDRWLMGPFHAIGILRPGLSQVAFARHSPSTRAGLDVLGGLKATSSTAAVMFPGNGSTIDLNMYGAESPSPIETCQSTYPRADYSKPALPMVVLLPQRPDPGLTVQVVKPGGIVVSSAGAAVCVVDENHFVSSDSAHAPAGRALLQSDHAVFVILRTRLVAGVYSVTLDQPGRRPIAWSFTSDPAPLSPAVFPYPSCSYSARATGVVRVAVVNPDESLGATAYTVRVGERAHRTSELADGAVASTSFARLPTGRTTVVAVGDDGSRRSARTRVTACPRHQASRARFGTPMPRRHRVRLVLDNTRNLGRTPFVVTSSTGTTTRVVTPGKDSRALRVRLPAHRTTVVTVTVDGHRVKRRAFGP